jgi:hypothetical protein
MEIFENMESLANEIGYMMSPKERENKTLPV